MTSRRRKGARALGGGGVHGDSESSAATSATIARLRLCDLPAEVIEHIARFLPLRDLAGANAASRLFRGAPGCRSPVENVLRQRAREHGYANALPSSLPSSSLSWIEELFALHRLHALAALHARIVVCGAGDELSFSALVDADGGLQTCGEEEVRNDAGDLLDEYCPAAAIAHPTLSQVLTPTRVPSLSAVRVRAAAAGNRHLLALSDTGVVYACGASCSGQLGLGDKELRASFRPVPLLAREFIACIAAGSAHSVALTAEGVAYSWGANRFSQLGHGDELERLEPRRIEALHGVRVGGAAAGTCHTLLLALEGSVYTCGSGSDGALGHGRRVAERTPRRVEGLASARAVHVSAARRHSLVVDAAGRAYSFGSGISGCLGHGDKCDQLAPKRIDALAGVRVVRACLSEGASAVVDAGGVVHAFGNNARSLLGHTPPMTPGCALPQPMDALRRERVVDCSLTWSHALFVTAGGSVLSCGMPSGALGHGVSFATATADLDTPVRIIAVQMPHDNGCRAS